MKKLLFIILIILISSALFAIPKYTIGKWSVDGHGNHRAVVRVSDNSNYNYVNIEWRRRDLNPEMKGLVIENEKGEAIEDYFVKNINNEYGEIIFKPKDVGIYYIYYLPYTNEYRGENTIYFSCSDYISEELKSKTDNNLPVAELVQIEAREYEEELCPNYNSMYPMEVVATEKEKSALKEKYKGEDFLLFPEDRYNQIKMFNNIPYHWAINGEKLSFDDKGRPYEYYVFNIGMYALKDINHIKMNIGDLKSENGTISSNDITCFNLSGIDWMGNKFVNEVNIKKDNVQALWIGISIPKDAKGLYKGVIQIGAENSKMKDLNVILNVEGEILEDRGDSDIFCLSRLRWLNDTSYLYDDTVVSPYIPLEYGKNSYSILDRNVEFNDLGLIKKYTSRGFQIFDGNMEFNLLVKGEKLKFNKSKSGWNFQNKATGIFSSLDENECISREINAKCEFDGCINYSVKLKAKEHVSFDDINMIIPLKKDAVKYMMGLGMQGNYCPDFWNWTWNPSRTDHHLWVGDIDAGLQLELDDTVNYFRYFDFGETGLPESWDNNGQGGIHLEKKGNKVVIKAYSGQRELKKGETIEFNYKLILTPFQQLKNDRFNHRYSGFGATRRTQWHGGKYSEYINYPIYNVEKLSKWYDEKLNSKSYPFEYIYPEKFNNEKGSIFVDIIPNIPNNLNEEDEFYLFESYFENGNDFISAYLSKEKDKIELVFNVENESGNDKLLVPFDNFISAKEINLSFVYGDTLKVYCDGVLLGEKKTEIKPVSKNKAFVFTGPWNVKKVYISDDEYISGDFNKHKNYYRDDFPLLTGKEIKRYEGIYFTTRELTVQCPEFHVLRSLGDEVLVTQQNVSGAPSYIIGDVILYPTIREHVDGNLMPAWKTDSYNGTIDASVVNAKLSRWHNFYVKGIEYLLKNTNINGYYIDQMSHDREIMKRTIRAFQKYRNNDYYMQIHVPDLFPRVGLQSNSSNVNMEMFAYATELWLGEEYYYSVSPAQWLTEVSGLTFGIPSQTLKYSHAGFKMFPYREGIYGMTCAGGLPSDAIWSLWDEFGISESEMFGYWDKKVPVNVEYIENNKNVKVHKTATDPILATCFVKKGEKVLVNIGSWQNVDRNISLNIDWKALGLDKNNVKIYAPNILNLQEAENIDLDNIFIEANSGKIILLINNR